MTNYNQKQYFVLQIGTKTSRGTKENKENSFVEGITFELDSEDRRPRGKIIFVSFHVRNLKYQPIFWPKHRKKHNRIVKIGHLCGNVTIMCFHRSIF